MHGTYKETLEIFYQWSQIFLLVTSIVALLFASYTVKSEREKKKGEAFVRMMDMMSEDTDFQEAYKLLLEELSEKRLHMWTAQDFSAAYLVASKFNKCGMMIKLGLIDRDLFLDHFAKRVVHCHEVLSRSAYLAYETAARKAIMWAPDFRELNKAAKKTDDRQSNTYEVFPWRRRKI